MGENVFWLPDMRPLPADDRHAARLTVCAHCTDTDDARTLLRCLGLMEDA